MTTLNLVCLVGDSDSDRQEFTANYQRAIFDMNYRLNLRRHISGVWVDSSRNHVRIHGLDVYDGKVYSPTYTCCEESPGIFRPRDLKELEAIAEEHDLTVEVTEFSLYGRSR